MSSKNIKSKCFKLSKLSSKIALPNCVILQPMDNKALKS